MSNPLKEFDIQPATASNKIVYIVAGPPGTGKSWLTGSMAEHGETLLIATLPRESKSYFYQKYGVDTVELNDPDWLPSLGRFEAEAYLQSLELFEALYDDEKYDNVILDNGTEWANELAWHECLKFYGVSSPTELDGQSKWDPYVTLQGKLAEGMRLLAGLSTREAVRPKHVAITWHVQPTKEDVVEGKGDYKKVKKSSDSLSKDVEYAGDILPNVRGGYRRVLASQVDCYLLTYLESVRIKDPATKKFKEKTKFMVQVQTNPSKHVKLPGKMPDEEYIDNNFTALKALLAPSMGGEDGEPKGKKKSTKKGGK